MQHKKMLILDEAPQRVKNTLLILRFGEQPVLAITKTGSLVRLQDIVLHDDLIGGFKRGDQEHLVTRATKEHFVKSTQHFPLHNLIVKMPVLVLWQGVGALYGYRRQFFVSVSYIFLLGLGLLYVRHSADSLDVALGLLLPYEVAFRSVFLK